MLKFILWILGGALAIIVALIAWLLSAQPDLSAYEPYYAPGAGQVPQGAVTIRFTGTSSILFSDGETAIMTDAWFTRPSTLAIGFGEIEPDIAAIEDGLKRLKIGKLAAIVPVHSHFDHAMDAPAVAERTGAVLVGSESTANIGRGWGLPESQIRTPATGEPLRFGAFTVTLLESRHFVFPNAQIQAANAGDLTITEPVTPPVKATAYKQGKAYSVLIEHPAGTALIQGSAGFEPGALDNVKVDALFLGLGGIAGQSAGYQDDYWKEIVEPVAPERLFAIHWDSFTHPIAEQGNRPAAPNMLWDQLFGLNAAGGIDYALTRGEAAGIKVELLPLWDEVILFAPPAAE